MELRVDSPTGGEPAWTADSFLFAVADAAGAVHAGCHGPNVQVVHARHAWYGQNLLTHLLDIEARRCDLHQDSQRLSGQFPGAGEDEQATVLKF